MKRSIRTAACVLGSAALLAAGAMLRGAVPGYPSNEIDSAWKRDRTLRLWSCEASSLWLDATPQLRRGETAFSGDAEAPAPRTPALVRVTTTGDVIETPLDAGAVMDVSEARDGAIWMVKSPGTARETSGLAVSATLGVTWRSVPVGSGVIGVVAGSATAAFAWSESVLYATTDGGLRWKALDVAPMQLPSGSSRGRAALGPDGRLWVAVNADAWAERQQGLVVLADEQLRSSEIARWELETVDGVAPVAPDEAVVVVRPIVEPGFRVYRVSTQRGKAPELVMSRNRGAVSHVLVGESAVVLRLIDFSPNSWLDFGRAEFVASRDAGRTWTRVRARAEGVASACLGSGGVLWTLSVSGELRRHAIGRGS